MGMCTRKHAIVVVLPSRLPTTAGPRDVHERQVAAMQHVVREYVTLAQRLQPREECGGENAHEAPRLLVSLSAFVGNGDLARAVAISAHASHTPRQLSANLEDQVKKWRLRGDGGDDDEEASYSCRGSRCGAFVGLLEELAAQQFNVSVLAPADALSVAEDASFVNALGKQTAIQFVLLRDEEEQSDVASRNMLLLLRAVKGCGSRQCNIRQVEDCELELESVVKEWLHAAAPIVRATLQLQETQEPLEMEIRANFVLLDDVDGVLSSTTVLPSHSSRLALVHLVPLASVHPALLMGCPLRASAAESSRIQALALSRFLRDGRSGALVKSSREDGGRVFYLLVASPGSDEQTLLMYRVAAAEEILLPDVQKSDGATPSIGEEDEEKVAKEIARLRTLPARDFNPFRNRSDALSFASAVPPSKRDQKTMPRSVSAKPSRPSATRGLPVAVTSTAGPKKKRRL